ncbi:unnamed protein product [Blepharisma stoltei]|uniref:Uncharacterized protein n=1 Tax=Blepharisma stoltei TaxID=1481888 RepID=A0AAU9K5I4_9CILI|nr:unnamed protein product [Blepharisma stoltei]
MSWIEKILPACCTGRRTQSAGFIDIKSPAESAEVYDSCITNDKPKIYQQNTLNNKNDRSVLRNSQMRRAKMKSVEEIVISDSIMNSIRGPSIEVEMKPCYGRDNFITLGKGDSRRSSKNPLGASDRKIVIDWFRCSWCNNEAKGSCTGCANQNFCIGCYHSHHKKLPKGHKFSYASQATKLSFLH